MNSKWFVRGDVDGFFGLFFDNLTHLMLITHELPQHSSQRGSDFCLPPIGAA